MTEQEFTLKLLSGEIAVNERGTFYFDSPGYHFDDDGFPFTMFLHRTNGPACEWTNGARHWYVNGSLHRRDGPAVESRHGNKWWFVDGVELSQEEFQSKYMNHD